MKIAVIGDGGWGTTLAVHLQKKGNNVFLWGAFPDYVEFMRQKRENKKFLPGIEIPHELGLTGDIEEAVHAAKMVVLAVPSHFMRGVLQQFPSRKWDDTIFISVSKGIENDTLKRMSEVIGETVRPKKVAVLSGPSHAEETARGIPTSVVVASRDHEDAKAVQTIFSSPSFRVYSSTDVVGVELGGSLKNVIAIAAGISDGLGFGDNSKAALMTRGIAEMMRLGVALGGKPQTFSGLSGIGDLITTCISRHSRNRNFGEMIGNGKSVEEALRSTEMVVEGFRTAKSVHQIYSRTNVKMPIAEEAYKVLYEGKKPLKAVEDLMMRDLKAEAEGA
ncbi:MAG TPA: NAD(P)H-dependent glycerol-3-phosphate dehydrogenase [bacterium]|nr:NAD(P)H-dependent glycerol-3-phosphate dehydrogenase [bacterium]